MIAPELAEGVCRIGPISRLDESEQLEGVLLEHRAGDLEILAAANASPHCLDDEERVFREYPVEADSQRHGREREVRGAPRGRARLALGKRSGSRDGWRGQPHHEHQENGQSRAVWAHRITS
jgi:hypothetical protein